MVHVLVFLCVLFISWFRCWYVGVLLCFVLLVGFWKVGLGWWVCFAPKSVGRGVQVLGWMKLQVPYPNCYSITCFPLVRSCSGFNPSNQMSSQLQCCTCDLEVPNCIDFLKLSEKNHSMTTSKCLIGFDRKGGLGKPLGNFGHPKNPYVLCHQKNNTNTTLLRCSKYVYRNKCGSWMMLVKGWIIEIQDSKIALFDLAQKGRDPKYQVGFILKWVSNHSSIHNLEGILGVEFETLKSLKAFYHLISSSNDWPFETAPVLAAGVRHTILLPRFSLVRREGSFTSWTYQMLQTQFWTSRKGKDDER